MSIPTNPDHLTNEIEQAFMQRGGWKECRYLVGKLTDELKRLRAIVAKLPKTADGVPVVPEMSALIEDDPCDAPRTCRIYCVSKDSAKIVFEDGMDGWAFCWSFYSTRQAGEDELRRARETAEREAAEAREKA